MGNSGRKDRGVEMIPQEGNQDKPIKYAATNSTDLSVQYDAKVHEFMKLLQDQQTIDQEVLLLRRDIINLEAKKADLSIVKSKAAFLVRQCRNELDLLKSAFFQARSGDRA